MRLPGGFWHQDELRRDFAFKPINGAVELAVAEGDASSVPARVTAVLAAALDHIGGEAVTPAMVQGLAVGDRQFLMRQLAVLLDMDALWLNGECLHCGTRFDFPVHQSRFPLKEAGEGFPFAAVETSAGICRFRVPTGADQEVVALIDDDEQAVRLLVHRCLLGAGERLGSRSATGLAEPRFTHADLASIERALEEVAPEVGMAAQVVCPDCGTTNVVALDPYICLNRSAAVLFTEIHTLAANYHWSEKEILGLPRARRQRYLDLIDRARGMAH
jgi:hypothetical protein